MYALTQKIKKNIKYQNIQKYMKFEMGDELHQHNMKHIQIIRRNYVEAMTGKPCCTSKHKLWASNIQVSLDSTLRTNKHNVFILHTVNYNK